jgi:hypothetical protein
VCIPTLSNGQAYDNLNRAEYFIDTDPGVGNATAISIASPSDSISLTLSITVSNSLSVGVHYLYIRTRSDTTKAWSLSEGQQFYIQPTINSAEYFYDTDPGVGNGQALALSGSSDSVSETYTGISTAGLVDGKHYLYMRTSDLNGRWSLAEPQSFYITSIINQYEYFIDVEPQIGGGTVVSISQPSDSISITSTVNVGNLSAGTHVIYIRSRDNQGRWSQYQSQYFNITPKVVAYQYFFDNDQGGGTYIALGGPADSVSVTTSVATTGLSAGNHTLYIRSLDGEGRWSIYEGQNFYIKSSIVAAEYFFDTDPGAGNGTSLAITSADSISNSYSISTSGLPSGLHFLSVRTQSEQGNWSLFDYTSFYITPRIIAFQYWFDTIPQFATGTKISIDSASQSDSVNISSLISVSCLDTGTHYLWVSILDENGHWSLPEPDTFSIIPASNILLSHTIPGPGPDGTPVRLIGGGGGGANYRYRDVTHGGNFQVYNTFIIPNDSVVIFQVRDTCGNYKNDTVTAPPHPQNMSRGGGTGTSVLNSFNAWVYLLDDSANIIAAVNDHGADLDTVVATYMVNSGSVRKTPDSVYMFMDRNWHINTKNNPTNDAGVRLYFLNSEFDSLNNADNTVNNIDDCGITKYHGTNQNLNIYDNIFGGGNTVLLNTSYSNYTGAATDGRYAEITVSSFSEFYLGNGNGQPLPLQLLLFDAKAQGDDANINWITATEHDMSHFEIERSINGSPWLSIGRVEATNTSSQRKYIFNDLGVLMKVKGKISYRLKEVYHFKNDVYSNINDIYIKDETRLFSKCFIYPNPTSDFLRFSNLNADVKNIHYQITDMVGNVVEASYLSGGNGLLAINHLAQGMYLITLTDITLGSCKIFKFQKIDQ